MPKRISAIEDVSKAVTGGRKIFVSYAEGKDLYSMGLHTFQDLARDAGAVYHIKRRVLVNTLKVNEYLENFCDSNR